MDITRVESAVKSSAGFMTVKAALVADKRGGIRASLREGRRASVSREGNRVRCPYTVPTSRSSEAERRAYACGERSRRLITVGHRHASADYRRCAGAIPAVVIPSPSRCVCVGVRGVEGHVREKLSRVAGGTKACALAKGHVGGVSREAGDCPDRKSTVGFESDRTPTHPHLSHLLHKESGNGALARRRVPQLHEDFGARTDSLLFARVQAAVPRGSKQEGKAASKSHGRSGTRLAVEAAVRRRSVFSPITPHPSTEPVADGAAHALPRGGASAFHTQGASI